jgi:hypothetical protein
MAKTINLSAAEAADGTGGFDKIVVYGVKSSMEPDITAEYLDRLFDGHHYTRGLAIVPQGTPTNNTEAVPTPVPREDEGGTRVLFEERGINGVPVLGDRQGPFDTADEDFRGSRSFTRGDFTKPPLGDAKALGWLLGVADGVFPNVIPPGAALSATFKDFAGREQIRAWSMNRVLWPALFGFFIDNILHIPRVANILDHDGGRTYFTYWVRARGPAPAFRIGDVPYGVLPVLSTARWAARGTAPLDVLEGKMLPVLKLLREQWLRGAPNVPRVTAGSPDPMGDLVKALAIYPSAREVRIRTAQGPLTVFNTSTIGRIDYQAVTDRLNAVTAGVFSSVGKQTDWKQTVLANTVHDRLASQIASSFVVPSDKLSETSGLLAGDYFLKFQTTSPGQAPDITDVFVDKVLFGADLHSTLLYRLVRHSLLLDIARVAAALVGPANFPRTQDRESTGIGSGSAAVPTYAQLLASKDFPVTGGLALGDYVFRNLMPADLKEALKQLAGTPTAELDRLVGETLDLASHRLDAWLTALATRRLVAIRDQNDSDEHPRRSYLGGYAFIENVRPVTIPTENRPGVGVVEVQPGNGGFIHAPSIPQATAAAILRGGSLAHRAEDPQKYAIDLSSGRVRAARQILDEIRAGQPLGAVLGQRFERRLKDGYPTNLGLDNYRYALRKRFPLVAGKSVPVAAGESVEAAAARNVVDGLALATNGITFGASDLPPSGSQAANALLTELQALRDSIDGVSDLVVSESVFQLARGATGTALGNMDALARGARPPDSELARTIRSGTGLTHRVALVIPENTTLSGAGWTIGASRRSAIDPRIDGWLADVLGNPTNVQCLVSLTPTKQGVSPKTKVVKLSDLGYQPAGGGPRVLLGPQDVLALARAVTAPNQGSILDRWIAAAALNGEHDLAFASVDYARQGTSRTFPELMEVAATAGELLAGARPLEPGDVSLPAETPDRIGEVEDPAKDTAQILFNLANDALAGLEEARDPLGSALTGAEIRAALEGVAAFIPADMPVPGATDPELAVTRDAVLADINRRIADAGAVPPPGPTSAELSERAVQILRVLFGDDFVATAPFPPPASGEIQHSLDDRAALLGTTTSEPITKLIQSAAQVQPGLARWRALALYLGVTGAPRPRLDVVQLPFSQGERWVARPYEGGPPAQPGRVSLVLLSPGSAPPSPTVYWRGLVIDQWVEQIPNASEDTGLAFHFDHPLAEAAQTILVAVPSSTGNFWIYDDVVATLNETFELAKLRCVDRELTDLGQLVPTAYLAEDAQRNTISTSLANIKYQAITGTG